MGRAAPYRVFFSYYQALMETSKGGEARRRFRLPPIVQHILKFALGSAAIWALIHYDALDPSSVAKAFLTHPWFCVAAFCFYVVLVLLAGWGRWYLLMRNAGLRISPMRCLSLHMIGIFFNSLIPGNGGDLIKGYYLFQDHEEGEKALALTSIAMDRLVGTYGLLCMGMAMTWFNYRLWIHSTPLRINSFFYAGVFLAFTVLIGLFLSPLSGRFLAHPALGRLPGGRFLTSLAQSLLVYRRRPRGLILVMGLGFAVDCGLIILYYLSARALDLGVPLLVHGFVVPTMTMVNGLPISPSGVGVGEAAGEMIYRNVGVTEGGSEILALVHICILAASLLGAPFYLLFRAHSRSGEAPS